MSPPSLLMTGLELVGAASYAHPGTSHCPWGLEPAVAGPLEQSNVGFRLAHLQPVLIQHGVAARWRTLPSRARASQWEVVGSTRWMRSGSSSC